MNRNIKILAGLVRYLSPSPIKGVIDSLSWQQEKKRSLNIAEHYHVSKEEFEAALAQIDLDGYDTVFLHTSLRNIGKVKGGVKFMVNTLLDFVGLDYRTLLVSALPYRGSFADYLTTHKTFDVRTAPIAMGSINEAIAKHDGALRSVHPTHSVVAIGPRASEFVVGHSDAPTPFAASSPYYKFVQSRGCALLIGATLNNMTFVHVIEDMLGDAFPIAPYCSKSFRISCTNADGKTVDVTTRCHKRFWGIFRDTERLLPDMMSCGAVRRWPLGAGYITQVDAYKFVRRYLELLSQGRSIYGRHWPSKELKARTQELISDLDK